MQTLIESLDSTIITDKIEDASDRAAYFMTEATRRIDEIFGDGYAKANPLIIGAFMNASAINANTESTTDALTKIAKAQLMTAKQLHKISDTLHIMNLEK